jgi:DNA-binding transcriptional regulator GbsR (MarR family)
VDERAQGIFVDGIGAACATSGVLSQLQGRIFGLLYLRARPLSLDDIADQLQQSKSHVSVNIRGLVEWHMVQRVTVAGSRKDHYGAVTDLWRVAQEIMERRFRWNLRQVLAAVEETQRAADAATPATKAARREQEFIAARLDALRAFAAAIDAGIGLLTQGQSWAPETARQVPPPPRLLPSHRA